MSDLKKEVEIYMNAYLKVRPGEAGKVRQTRSRLSHDFATLTSHNQLKVVKVVFYWSRLPQQVKVATWFQTFCHHLAT